MGLWPVLTGGRPGGQLSAGGRGGRGAGGGWGCRMALPPGRALWPDQASDRGRGAGAGGAGFGGDGGGRPWRDRRGVPWPLGSARRDGVSGWGTWPCQ